MDYKNKEKAYKEKRDAILELLNNTNRYDTLYIATSNGFYLGQYIDNNNDAIVIDLIDKEHCGETVKVWFISINQIKQVTDDFITLSKNKEGNCIIEGICPKCGTICLSEGVDIGIGYIHPPFHCQECGYSRKCDYYINEEECKNCTEYEKCYLTS